MVEETGIRCSECDREVDEFTAIAEKWGYWSNGVGDLVPFRPERAKREFAPDALPIAQVRRATPGGAAG
jgi:hypothetical protein